MCIILCLIGLLVIKNKIFNSHLGPQLPNGFWGDGLGIELDFISNGWDGLGMGFNYKRLGWSMEINFISKLGDELGMKIK